jgi:FtsZ-binding cell division protein ZapB
LQRAKNDSIWIWGDKTPEAGKAIEPRVCDLETKVNTVVNTDIPALQTRLTTAEGNITDLQTRVQDLEDDVAVLKTDAENLKNDQKNMITGIIIQATQNPVVGYLNLPLDVRSTLLSVYYGKPDADWSFPSKSSANYVNATDINLWTARNASIIGDLASVPGYVTGSAGETVVTQKDGGYDGNAGTLYVTVNPNTVDFTGKELKLKDSQDGDAPVTLAPLAKSDRQLTHGWHGSANNGFY